MSQEAANKRVGNRKSTVGLLQSADMPSELTHRQRLGGSHSTRARFNNEPSSLSGLLVKHPRCVNH